METATSQVPAKVDIKMGKPFLKSTGSNMHAFSFMLITDWPHTLWLYSHATYIYSFIVLFLVPLTLTYPLTNPPILWFSFAVIVIVVTVFMLMWLLSLLLHQRVLKVSQNMLPYGNSTTNKQQQQQQQQTTTTTRTQQNLINDPRQPTTTYHHNHRCLPSIWKYQQCLS